MEKLIWFSKAACDERTDSQAVMLIQDRNSVFVAAVVSGIITALLVLLISVQIASSAIYAALAGLVGFGLVLLIYSNPRAGAFFGETPEERGTGTDSSSLHSYASTFSGLDLFSTAGVLVSSVVIYAVPSMGRNMIWADWLAISIFNYVRIIAAVLLTTFLPGYFLLRVLDIRRQLRSIEIVILACLLSLFLVPLVCVATSALGFTLSSFGGTLLVSLNFGAFFAFLVVRLLKAHGQTLLPDWNTEKIRNLRSACSEQPYFGISVVGVLVLVLAISYRLFPYPPYLIGDQWPHLDAALLYERYGNPILATRLIPYAYGFYPQWFHIYLASLLSISGAPLTNTYFAINFTNIFGLLALYLLALSFFKSEKRKLAALTLALALFSGFGWAYDLWLRLTGGYSNDVLTQLVRAAESSYDILFPNTYFGSAHPELTSDLQVMALPALVMLLVLTNRGDLKGWMRYVLISLLTALAFLGHVAEGGMFVATLVLALVLTARIHGACKVAVATFVGIIITGAVGAMMSDGYYLSLTAYYLTLILSAVAIPLAWLRQRLPGATLLNLSSLNTRRAAKLALSLSLVGLTVWVGLILIWRFTHYAVFTWIWTFSSYFSVPYYMYPSRFGVLGLLAIPAVLFLILVWKRGVRGLPLVSAFAFVSLALGRIWMLPQSLRITSFLEEFRQNKYVALALTLPVAFFASRSLTTLGLRRSLSRWLLGGFLVGVLLFAGFASTILYAEFTTLAYATAPIPSPDLGAYALTAPPAFGTILSHELSPQELAALQYLRDNMRLGDRVAVIGTLDWVPGGFPYTKVTFMGSLLKNQTFSLSDLYGLTNRTEIYGKLVQENVRFVYLSQQELGILSQHPMLYEAILELPIAYSNQQVTIYTMRT